MLQIGLLAFSILLVLGVNSPAGAAAQATGLCKAISDALGRDSPAYAELVSVGRVEVPCKFNQVKDAWACVVEKEDRCGRAASQSDAGKKIKDAYAATMEEIAQCAPSETPRALDYQKWSSTQDGYISRGSLFQSLSQEKYVYVTQRIHGFVKDAEVCLGASMQIEVEPPAAFEPFGPEGQ